MLKTSSPRQTLAMPIIAGLPHQVPLSGARSCCHLTALKIKPDRNAWRSGVDLHL